MNATVALVAENCNLLYDYIAAAAEVASDVVRWRMLRSWRLTVADGRHGRRCWGW
jgi:hypothetical protein